jgi:hypothetical protein
MIEPILLWLPYEVEVEVEIEVEVERSHQSSVSRQSVVSRLFTLVEPSGEILFCALFTPDP